MYAHMETNNYIIFIYSYLKKNDITLYWYLYKSVITIKDPLYVVNDNLLNILLQG